MRLIYQTWADNRHTFGGGGDRWSTAKVGAYYITLSSLSILISLVSTRPSNDFFDATLTAISIIAGFTFNAVIFFVDHKFVVQKDTYSLEQASRQQKIDRLAENTFSIIYYFNVVSIFVCVMCIIALVMPSISAEAPHMLARHFGATEAVGRSTFFAGLVEAMVTFLRALRRLRYLFKKIREAH